MTQQTWSLLGVGLYIALFIISVGFVAVYRVKKLKLRPPLEFKLLRGPGEALRRRIGKFEEEAVFRLSGAAIVPILATGPLLGLMTRFKPSTWTQLSWWFGALIVIFAVVLIFAFRWALRDFSRYRNDRLGYLGERAVGDALVPLTEAGYKVFHDVPAEAGGHTFNVDHVAVGSSGVFAIETKTRRKGRARPGYEDHKVAYDGQQLIWPWGEDTFGLENAENRASWLTDWLNKMTGLGLAAKPVLVLPGWYVVTKGIGPVTVVTHKQLSGAILRHRPGVLTGEQVDLIARQLDERCRDVED